MHALDTYHFSHFTISPPHITTCSSLLSPLKKRFLGFHGFCREIYRDRVTAAEVTVCYTKIENRCICIQVLERVLRRERENKAYQYGTKNKVERRNKTKRSYWREKGIIMRERDADGGEGTRPSLCFPDHNLNNGAFFYITTHYGQFVSEALSTIDDTETSRRGELHLLPNT